MAAQGSESFRRLRSKADQELEDIAERVRSLTRAQERFHGLLDAFLALNRELELPSLLRELLKTAQELVGARYGAMGVLDETGERLADFIPVGLSEEEERALAGVPLPHGLGLLGHLIRHPEPLRVETIAAHPESVGFPEGHPPMSRLLGVSIRVRDQVYGNLYLTDRRDGLPFDEHDEAVLVALASAAAVAIDNARLFASVRASAELFQRLLLPRLPDLAPYEARAVYRPAAAPGNRLGGDWYDAVPLPDGSCAVVIGDVVGHDVYAAAAMAQARNMLRALLYERRKPPSTVLGTLDRTLHAITDLPVTTACLARVWRDGDGERRLSWSSAGHPPPLLISPAGSAHVLSGEPGLPLGVDVAQPRPDHELAVPPGSTLVLYTDGLVERRGESLDEGLRALETAAGPLARAPLAELCAALADFRPEAGQDDTAVLALRVPEADPVTPSA
ncbi:PP2C family protein-serine/threonine phosphatase [Streptomyces sp. GSL17-111]|uniref:PP2C family protein-serine/threonine phosphatase n=1 Tax=Streptomyces sp. GSL17-111 TaxID=3121596 RepID=UPI0030F4A978